MSKRILLADDSLTIQKVVELTFMDEDFEVEAVGSGDEAIRRLDGELPSILIADVHMPGASGYEVCRRAKAMSADLPVLLLVGTFEALDENEMVACGADGNLKKPFDSQELLQRVRRMTRGDSPTRVQPPAIETLEGLETTSHYEEFAAAPAELPVTGFDLGGGFAEGLDVLQKEAAEFGIASTAGELEGEPELAPVDLGEDLETDIGTYPLTDTESEGPEDEFSRDLYGSDNETVLIAAAPTSAPPEVAESAGGNPPATAGALSDTDIDRVARRVVELMSDDAVREVAWDVIPDMAEIVIKARVRELEAETD